ncbi:MAG: DEAD/DEAH box helicase [Actinomycetota bacterium]
MDIAAFEAGYSFRLDVFQRQGIDALAGGRSALVCAPTGAGKTVVGEFGVWLALQTGGKAFYTTPLKALSNQKYGDFIARHGARSVGLLTGDNSLNGEAPAVVMTTEVLRNMLYETSPTLRDLKIVVMDEVHFLKDPYRGATWEEILIHLPPGVQVAALSATVSNANEFGDWLRSVRGPTDVIVEHKRPVPIEHRYLVGQRLEPMFVEEGGARRMNRALLRLAEPEQRGRGRGGYRGPPRGGARGSRRAYVPDRVEVVERLRAESLLPAIVFIFSRAGCQQAVDVCRAAGLRLTDAQERERIREYVAMRTASLPEEDHAVLGYDLWVDALERGIAAHHAGLIPLFKETVEELFERALVKVVFATETLALGINMPAKTVVIERLVKWTGERHELMTPTDYTQLTGRAGRRGMDTVGYGITLFQRDITFDRIASLAEGREFPLISSFRPSYNMAVNLLRTHTVEDATRLLNLSFGQFLADRSVGRLQREIEKNERFLDGYRGNILCDRGDFAEYWALASVERRARADEVDTFRRDRARAVREAFGALRRGDVVPIRRDGLAAVLDVRTGKSGDQQPLVLTMQRRLRRLAIRDFREPPVVVGSITIPKGDVRSARVRHEVARALEALPPAEPRELDPKRRPKRESAAALETYPVHACPDREEHERWMIRIEELERETAALRRRVRARTETLARTFERVIAVLETFGYIAAETVTEKGDQLARIYNESDLLVAEAIGRGVFDELEPGELAAVASTVVFETRMGVPDDTMPNDRTDRAWRGMVRLYRQIHDAEEQHRLTLVREPDPGFAWQIHRWASEAPLEEVLEEGEMSAGDFVRSVKQVWDLLRQLAEIEAGETFSARCRDAAKAIYRGVVAYSGAL